MEQKKSTHKGVSIKDLPLLFCGVLLASIIISTVLIYIYDQGFRISVRDVFLLYHYGIRGSRSWQMAGKDHLMACEGPGVSEAKPSTKYDLTLFVSMLSVKQIDDNLTAISEHAFSQIYGLDI